MPGRYQFSLPSRRMRDGWFRLGNLDVTTTALLVLLGAASMVWWAIDSLSLERLWFTGFQVRSGEVWRLVTWPIPNPPRDIWVVITLAFFWFVGHAIEDRIGRKPFTVMLLATIVLPAAITTALGMNRVGVGGLSILGLGLALALLVMSGHFSAAAQDLIETNFGVAQRMDVTLTFAARQQPHVLHELARLPGVLTLEPLTSPEVILESSRHTRRDVVFDDRMTRITLD